MIELKNVSKVYKMGNVEVPALTDISLKILDGEFVAIMGPSGSGKSTLLNMLGCLDTPTSGSYLLDNENVSELSAGALAEARNDKIGFVFQTFNLLPRLTAMANVELPLIYAGDQRERKQKAVKALDTVNLKDRVLHRPRELSGGEQQRVAIARSLVNEPTLILADEPTGNLDSKSGKEIISILSELNKKRITVILVTHDESIASHTNRVIKLYDGKIVEDKKNSTSDREDFTQNLLGAEAPSYPLPPTQVQQPHKRRLFSFSELSESVSMARASIFSNKLRSLLTMLGIIVGVACVIVMVSLGEGASSEVTKHIKNMGANLLTIYPGSARMGHARMARGSISTLTNEDANAIIETCPDITKVAPSYSSGAQVVYGNENTNTRVIGTTPSFPEVRNFAVENGSFFNDYDDRFMKRVAILGRTVIKELFGAQDPIGEYIKINRTNFQVIGTMATKGSSGWQDEDDAIWIPLKTAQKRLFGRDHLSTINVQVTFENLMDKATSEITSLLRERHKIREDAEDDFGIFSQAEILATVKETTKTFTMLLTGIAIVSLIVGGIGIMNIMLVSVTERTREIGIRKAIGAQRKDILGQFLTEAVILSLSGGIIGIILGILISKVSSNFTGWTLVVSPTPVALAFFFAVAIGLFFGFYPAHKASLLNPIEALRYE